MWAILGHDPAESAQHFSRLNGVRQRKRRRV